MKLFNEKEIKKTEKKNVRKVYCKRCKDNCRVMRSQNNIFLIFRFEFDAYQTLVFNLIKRIWTNGKLTQIDNYL